MLRCIRTEQSRDRHKNRDWDQNNGREYVWFRCNVKASTQLHTAHLFPVPVSVSISASVNTPLKPCSNVKNWLYGKQVMTFTFNICIFKNETAKTRENANAEVTCECTLRLKSVAPVRLSSRTSFLLEFRVGTSVNLLTSTSLGNMHM